MTYTKWNDSFELGRALSDPEWRKHGLAALPMHRAIGEVREQRLGQIFYGFPRVRRIAELCETTVPAFIVAGHDDGRNVANGARETHLIVYAVPSYARFAHIAPRQIGHHAFVRRDFYEPLGLQPTIDDYPDVAFIGPPAEDPLSFDDFVVAYNPASAHRGIEILTHGSPGASPEEICNELDALFRRFPDVAHASATVLADKIDLIQALRKYGFEVVAYLPAWYPERERRYDCVQLAKRAYAERPLVQGFEDILHRLAVGLSSLIPSESADRPRPPRTSRAVAARTSQPVFGSESHAALSLVPTEPENTAWRPLFFRLSSENDRAALVALLARRAGGRRVFDTLPAQLRDLIKTRNPSRKLSTEELDALVAAHVGGRPLEEYGVWVYYSWSDTLVHLLDEAEFAELRTNRNRNKITAAEQARLMTKRIGVVGLSVGHSAALTIALERQCCQIRLADFDAIDLSNLNRIRTGVQNLGIPKVYVAAREIAEIDPFLDVRVFSDGLTAENIDVFLLDGGKLDVVVEECDSLDVKVLVRHVAKEQRIPVVMETSDRGMLDIERFDLEPARPIFHGLAADLRPETLRGLTTEQKLPFVLQINGADTLSDRLLASMIEIDQTISTWPQLGSEVVHGGASAAHGVRQILLGQADYSGRFLLDLHALGPNQIGNPTPAHQVNGSAARTPTHGSERVTDRLVRNLVSQAILAPSGGNTQPWIWCARDSAVDLFLDRQRTAGLIDIDAGGSIVALGCAAENFILAAHAADREVRVEVFPDGERPDHAARFSLLTAHASAAEPHWRDDLSRQIGVRCTNRTIGPRRPFADADREALGDAVRSIRGADVQWATSDTALARLGEVVGAVDRLRILHPQTHREMYREIRWTREEVESTADGIDVATLGLSPSDLAGLRICRRWSAMEFVKAWTSGDNLEKMSRKHVAASSAIGLITMPAADGPAYFNAGRAVERMWLTATERGVAVHPITSAPYFFALLLRKGGQGLDLGTIAELRSLRAVYEQLFDVTNETGEMLLFRVAYNPAVTSRSIRRPIDDVLRAMA
jgi:tRNA A37 threonylcarbamoyladenosine dehydratase